MSREDELSAIFKKRGYHTDEEWLELMILVEGKPSPGIRADAAYAETYRGKVPDMLIWLWLEYGWGGWNRGKFWICDPALLQPLLDEVFDGDPDYDPKKMTAFAYDAFGTIHIWLGNYSKLHINWLSNYASQTTFDNWYDRLQISLSESVHIIIDIYGAIPNLAEGVDGNIEDAIFLDEENRDMLPLAIKRLGELNYGEIYGFFPALSMGGARLVENLQKVPILEHLVFLSQIQSPILYHYELPKENEAGFGTITPIRSLGHAGR